VTLHVELVSPERILYSGEADMVVCRTIGGGDIAFLTGHAPFVGALDIHAVRIRRSEGGQWDVIAVHGGFVEVSRDRVTILSDVAELASEIDVDRARRAEEALARGGDLDEEDAAALQRARMRVQVATGSLAGAAH
jgi:F-type H+-transporting ATPase subunit epsilon